MIIYVLSVKNASWAKSKQTRNTVLIILNHFDNMKLKFSGQGTKNCFYFCDAKLF